MTQPRLLGGRYELDGVIGHGGMAEVYRARDLRLDRIVAVKTLRPDLAHDQVSQARFRREAQSAASLNHPSIIAVYDTGEDTAGDVPVPYIVMEYADGRTVSDLLRDGRRLRPERALEIVDGVLDALGYSHRNGIVHRDIKPSNVMLTHAGDIKVMDFGIARSVSAGDATITQTAQVIGTAQYMSPEQVRGERVDARSDLYSAGCLLYELLTGRPPFRGDSPVAIAYQHVRENPVPPSQLDPEIPRWAEAITLKAMAKDPADRYQSAAEMRADIQRAMSGVPGPPPPAQTRRQTQPVGGTALVAPPTSALPGYQYGEGQQPPSRRRRRTWLWALCGLLAVAAVAAGVYFLLAGGGKTYPVPDVRGLTQQQASQKISASHLQAQFTNQVSASVPKGQVIGTSPAAGTMLAAHSVVDVFLSAGQQQVAVPDVVGQDVASAQATLKRAGLNPVVATDNTATGPEDTVLRQNPAGGTQVKPGSTVTIVVPGTGVKVQDVRGEPAGTAKSILRGQGFTVKEVKSPGPSSVQAGHVYAQNPSGGTTLARGSTVTIYVQPPTPGIVATPATVSVTQGSTGTFSVTLSAKPSSSVTVMVNFESGNSGLSVTSGGTLTFTPANWDAPQTVTISADSSGTGAAEFKVSAASYTPATVTVTETPSGGGG